MKPVTYPIRTQISLSPQLKQLIETEGLKNNETLTEYLRRAAILRLTLDSLDKKHRKTVADMVCGSIDKKKSGWKNIKNISAWQRRLRREEDEHRLGIPA